jgi:hypothetical protein
VVDSWLILVSAWQAGIMGRQIDSLLRSCSRYPGVVLRMYGREHVTCVSFVNMWQWKYCLYFLADSVQNEKAPVETRAGKQIVTRHHKCTEQVRCFDISLVNCEYLTQALAILAPLAPALSRSEYRPRDSLHPLRIA